MKGQGNLSFQLVKRPKRTNRSMQFMAVKKLRKLCGFGIYSLKTAVDVVKRDHAIF